MARGEERSGGEHLDVVAGELAGDDGCGRLPSADVLWPQDGAVGQEPAGVGVEGAV